MPEIWQRWSGRTSLGRHFVLLLAERGIQLLVTLLLSSVLARQLGAAEFGHFHYLLSLLTFAVPLYSLGLARILVRELTVTDRPRSLLYSAMQARFFAGCAVALAGGLCFLLLEGQERLSLLFALLLGAQIFYAFDVYQFWFQQQNMHSYLAGYRLLTTLLFAAAKITTALLLPSLDLIVLLHACELIAIPALYRWLFLHHTKAKQLLDVEKFDFAQLKPVLQQSFYLVASGFAAVLYLRLDIVMLTHMQGAESAGIYAAATKLSELWYTVPALLFMVAAPRLLLLHHQQSDLYQLRLKQLLALVFYLAVLFAVFISFSADWLIHLLYGEGFQLAATILICHVWSGVFVAWREGLSQWLVAERFAQFSLVSHLSGACVNIVLNLWWIPQYGAVGAAWATVVAFFVSGFLCLWFQTKTRLVAKLMLASLLYPLQLLKARSSKP